MLLSHALWYTAAHPLYDVRPRPAQSYLSLLCYRPAHRSCRTTFTPAEAVAKFANLNFSTSPRAIMQYSNLHYVILQAIVQDLAHQPYAKFVKENIFDPLGMSNATFDFPAAVASQQAVSGFYRKSKDVKALKKGLRHWDQAGTIKKEWIGEAVGLGLWTDEEAEGTYGPVGVMLSLKDMVS